MAAWSPFFSIKTTKKYIIALFWLFEFGWKKLFRLGLIISNFCNGHSIHFICLLKKNVEKNETYFLYAIKPSYIAGCEQDWFEKKKTEIYFDF